MNLQVIAIHPHSNAKGSWESVQVVAPNKATLYINVSYLDSTPKAGDTITIDPSQYRVIDRNIVPSVASLGFAAE